MTMTGCEPATMELTRLLGRAEVASALRAIVQTGGTPEQVAECLLSHAGEATIDIVRMELTELPPHLLTTACQAWMTADHFGKQFELMSVRPDSALTFARERRIRITIDTEEDCVRMTLSHIPGRHATWLTPPVPALAGA